MRTSIPRLLLLLTCALTAACSTRSLPKYEKPLARSQYQRVRTTAYTHSESDHRKYGRRTALGTPLQSGPIHSAACDWSRWPAGTVFRIVETGEIYQVDDYGWALSGTNTIDLYRPSRYAMNSWGVRRVNLEVLHWGDAWRSYDILKPRAKHKHVQRMLKQIRERYAGVPRSRGTPVARAVAVNTEAFASTR